MNFASYVKNLVLATVTALPVVASADDSSGIAILPSFSIRQETGVVGGDQTGYDMDLRLGYVISNGLYFGMTYSQIATNGVNAINQRCVGNSIGYFYGPASAVLSYFLMASQTEPGATGVVTRSDGSGTQLDFAYVMPLIWGISFGPTLSYKTLSFKKQEVNGQVQGTDHVETYLYPFVGFKYIW